jgi:hypothetical protein
VSYYTSGGAYYRPLYVNGQVAYEVVALPE